jgi:hypothetical protein
VFALEYFKIDFVKFDKSKIKLIFKGFTGVYCEYPINPCEGGKNPCEPNGFCYYMSPGDYYCKVKIINF